MTAKKVIAILLLVALTAPVLSVSASASASAAPARTIAWGAANSAGDSVRIRSGPGLVHDVIGHANRGDAVVIIERTNDEWYRVNYAGIIGYMSVPLLERPRTAADFNATGKIKGSDVNMRERPAVNSASLGRYSNDTVMSIIGINNGWYKVRFDGKTGYVRSDFMDLISTDAVLSAEIAPVASAVADAETTVPDSIVENLGSAEETLPGSIGANPDSAYVAPSEPAPDYNEPLGQQIVDYALSLLGSKYVSGGASPSGFDCSGFTYYVYKQFNINLTRNASGQYSNNGVHIDKSELSPGDLVFTSSNGKNVTHVGIYIGNNNMVHASTSTTGVIISSLDSANYIRTYFGAKRVIS